MSETHYPTQQESEIVIRQMSEALRRRDVELSASILQEVDRGFEQVNKRLEEAVGLLSRIRSEVNKQERPAGFNAAFVNLAEGMTAFLRAGTEELNNLRKAATDERERLLTREADAEKTTDGSGA